MSSPSLSKGEKPVTVGCVVTKPKNVSSHMWEKFKALEKRTDEVTKRSTEQRIRQLQKTALENVTRGLTHPDDTRIVNLPQVSDSDISLDCKKSDLPNAEGSLKRPLSLSTEEINFKKSKYESDQNDEKQWDQVKRLLGVNSHLAATCQGHLGPKTVLELKIEEAIATGNIQKAVELSDYMSIREFGEKITQAMDAKTFMEEKEKEEEMATARQKKLCWGFEAKERWETKSNM